MHLVKLSASQRLGLDWLARQPHAKAEYVAMRRALNLTPTGASRVMQQMLDADVVTRLRNPDPTKGDLVTLTLLGLRSMGWDMADVVAMQAEQGK